MNNCENEMRLKIEAFNGGRTFEQRKYCRSNFSKVYMLLENMVKNGVAEIYIKSRDINDCCYSKMEILDIITDDINAQHNAEIDRLLYVDKQYLFKGWRIVSV